MAMLPPASVAPVHRARVRYELAQACGMRGVGRPGDDPRQEHSLNHQASDGSLQRMGAVHDSSLHRSRVSQQLLVQLHKWQICV